MSATFRLNCTFMELKYDMPHLVIIKRVCLNCTFMELKSVTDMCSISGNDSLNCTFMELKFLYATTQEADQRVLIVPLWN